MKIALIGAPSSGKTTYFSGLYLAFRNSIAFKHMTDGQIMEAQKRGLSEQFSFRVSISDSDLDGFMSRNSASLLRIPVEYPNGNIYLDKGLISGIFAFRPLTGDQLTEKHIRDFTIFDPPGGAFHGLHEKSDDIVEEMASCDVFIVLLDAENIMEALRRKSKNEAFQFLAALGKIDETIRDASSSLIDGDILPVCFMISKFDILQENVIKEVNDLIYDNLILPYSGENDKYMICVCPTSVVDQKHGEFSPYNLEWPFIFSVAGTIFRNSLAVRADADTHSRLTHDHEVRAREVERGSWWLKLTAYLRGTGVDASKARARELRDKRGRLITIADDDLTLARKLWGRLSTEGRARHVRVFMGGSEIDPAIVAD